MAPTTRDVLHSTGSADFPAHRPRGARRPVSAFSEVRTKMKPRNPINQRRPHVPLWAVFHAWSVDNVGYGQAPNLGGEHSRLTHVVPGTFVPVT